MTNVDQEKKLDFSITKEKPVLTNQGLPLWVQHPIPVSSTIETSPENIISYSKFRLSEFMLNKLEKKGVTHFFPAQEVVIPQLFGNRYYTHTAQRDVCVSASTGSGKTLAYCVPIVEALLDRTIVELRALIVLPTRDLAIQVKQELDFLVQGSDLLVGALTGGTTINVDRVDILVCTPGRFMDFLTTNSKRLYNLRFLVMDEADRLMNQYFHGWLQCLQTLFEPPKPFSVVSSGRVKYPNHVQKLLFSATLSTNPAKLARLQLHNPLYICVKDGEANLPATLTEQHYVVEKLEKPLAMLYFIETKKLSGVLIFVKSVSSASRLAILLQTCCDKLKNGVQVRTIHSDMDSDTRKLVMREFMDGKVNVLTCSDIMARGMDLGQTVRYVINYDVPSHLVTYIHRVGRTARAGRTGTAITILEPKQAKWFKGIRKTEKKKVKETQLSTFTDVYQVGLVALRKKFGNQGGVESDNENEQILENSDNMESDSSNTSSSSSSSEDSDSDTPSRPKKKQKK